MTFRRGFSLIEMLVVLGILAILLGATVAAYSRVTRSAERARAQELVSDVATALTVIFQKEGAWPPRLLTAAQGGMGRLDEDVARTLVKYGVMTLSNNGKSGSNLKLTGLDKFGVVTPWATAALKRARGDVSSGLVVGSGCGTVKDHILYYALDLDGDGIVRGANVGGKSVNVRAQAVVWCCGRNGVVEAYRKGGGTGKKNDDVYSWQPGQTENVN